MKAIRLFLILAFVSLSTSLLFNGAGYAASFDCEGATIEQLATLNVDLDTGICHVGTRPDSDEISILNYSDATLGEFVLNLYNGTSGYVSNATYGTGPVDDDWLVSCDENSSCTVSVGGTHSGKPYDFDLSWHTGSELITLSNTSGAPSPEIAVAETGQGAVADGGTLAQGTQAAGSATTLTFTVTNSGNDDLTLETATSSALSNVTVNSISAPGSTTVSPSGTTTFTVEYTPTSGGAFSFDLGFANNDDNENPYTFTVSGTAVAPSPEISVAETGLGQGDIADGGTLGQGTPTAGSETTLTFTVTNSGTADLTLGAATFSHPTNVTVNAITSPAPTVSPNGTTTFTVKYTPTSAGGFSFDLSFANNDDNENPYDFTITGRAVAPEIAVAETGQGQGAVADGGTLAQGTQAAGSATTLTFTVTNSGDGDLTLATATSSAPSNVTVNAISAPASTTVSPSGTTTTFTVQYTPTSAGAFSFDLSFANNDSDEDPYNFTISGSATGAPEISVAETGQGQGAVADGGTLAQGTQAAGSATNLTFTVTNSGTADLTLGTATSSAPSNVTVNAISSPGSTTVSPSGTTTTFTVQYTPTSAGAFSFNLSFANNDSDEDPFNFTISGSATGAPEISVAETGQGQGAVADGGTLAQGTQAAGSATNLTFTVTNSGTADLTLGTATSSAPSNVTVNAISSPGSTTVSPSGTTTTFTVQYTPTSAGAFSFDLSFANNDSDEDPFNFTVSGTAVGPEITVKWGYPAQEIANGGTLAQGTKLTHSVMNLSFTVTNSGTADLTLENMKVLSSSNITNAGFLGGSSKTISPGGNAILDFLYTPTDPGAFSLEISFDTNDSDEDPFTFTLSGTAVAPEISVTSSEGGAIADGGTDTIASKPLAGSAATITYTIKNDGTAPLSVYLPTPSSNVTSTKNVTVNSFSLASTSLSAGETTTLEVNYTVTTPGAFNFAFHFSNGDIVKNPFNITASGNAKGAPEVVVEWGSPAQEIANGGTLAYGNQPAGSETVLSFTVTNSGNADLTLANMRVVSSNNVTNAGLRAYGKTTVWQGEETFIAYAYTPIDPGKFSLEVSFDNNDSDENPYTFTISGTATEGPEIEVAETGLGQGDIADGGHAGPGNSDTRHRHDIDLHRDQFGRRRSGAHHSGVQLREQCHRERHFCARQHHGVAERDHDL